jgi:ABC-type transporter Mla subunit MlaD
MVDPVVDVAQRAAAAARGLTPADRQTIDKVVADLKALKSAHKQYERPSENLIRFQQAYPDIYNMIGTVKNESFWSEYAKIFAARYPKDPNPRAPTNPIQKLKSLNKYRHVNIGSGKDDTGGDP